MMRDHGSTLNKFQMRRYAYNAAKSLGYTSFRTLHDEKENVWTVERMDGESPAQAWANGKEWIAWVETDWRDKEGGGRERVGVCIVSITREELAEEIDRDLPPLDFRFEPQTPDLWTPERASTVAAKPSPGRAKREDNADESKTRAKSDVASPSKLVWETADKMVGASRADVVAACVEAGVNKAMASTQFYRWQKARSA